MAVMHKGTCTVRTKRVLETRQDLITARLFINSEATYFNSKHTLDTDTDTRNVVHTRALTQGPHRKIVGTVLLVFTTALLFIASATPRTNTANTACTWLMQS